MAQRKKKPAPATTASRKKRGPPKGAPARGGSWAKGQSGNPRGRKPDKELAEAREYAAKLIGPYAEEVVKRLVKIATKSRSENAAIMAARELLNRLWGRPPQAVQLSGKVDAAPVVVGEIRFVSSDGTTESKE